MPEKPEAKVFREQMMAKASKKLQEAKAARTDANVAALLDGMKLNDIHRGWLHRLSAVVAMQHLFGMTSDEAEAELEGYLKKGEKP